MSVVDVIRRRLETVALERRAGITIVDGFPKEGTPTTSNIQAHVQQAQAKDLRNLPPGQSTQDWRVCWTETELLGADRITINGVQYTVQQVEFWDQGPFYKALMTDVDEEIP